MFLPSEGFGFVASLQDHWRSILAECLDLPPHEFTAWPEHALYDRGWDVYGLYLQGRPMLENCLFCPLTARLLRDIPGLVTAGFSRLETGTAIKPHVGYSDRVLRLHLALQAPPACGLRVGSETRRWIAGQCLIFDDTVEHEAWNHGPTTRLVLLVDFARPGRAQS